MPALLCLLKQYDKGIQSWNALNFWMRNFLTLAMRKKLTSILFFFKLEDNYVTILCPLFYNCFF